MTKQTPNRFTVTAALPYANGPKHIGHLAGAYLPADVFVRFLRANQKDVLFVCGSDEHGTAIANQALKEGTTPKAIIDKYHNLNQQSFEALGISFDVYHRTSDQLHHETAQEFFTNLYNKGLLTEMVSDQYFDEKAQQFLADRYIIGTCPSCGHTEAYGDQCESCGTSLSPSELISPRSTLSGEKPILQPTKHWYLPLDKYEDFLRQWILINHKSDWKPNVYGQCKSWIEGGLQARAVTRDLDWGIKVPLQDADGKVLYVWFDAPIGYISATKYWAEKNGKDWKPYWMDDSTALIHFIGKDNIVFHCIIFPVMLHAHGGYILPQQVPANEFMNLEGNKMSTSRQWSIEMDQYLISFPDKPDVLRYCLLSNLPETKDSEFTWRDFQTKNNSELVGILGNFVNRVVVLMHKYYDGLVPLPSAFMTDDLRMLESVAKCPSSIEESILNYRFREALAHMMQLARDGNKYLADSEPWKTIKTDKERTATILYVAAQVVAALQVVIEPFLPFSAIKLKEQLNNSFVSWQMVGNCSATFSLIKSNTSLAEPKLLFEKIEDEEVEREIAKLNSAIIANSNTVEIEKTFSLQPLKANIEFDDFSKLDLRCGLILEAERIPKADKLLKLLVDLGFEHRTIVSGIAQFFSPDDLIGKSVTVVANLAPRKLRGVESQGMILLAENANGNLVLISPNNPINPGAIIN